MSNDDYYSAENRRKRDRQAEWDKSQLDKRNKENADRQKEHDDYHKKIADGLKRNYSYSSNPSRRNSESSGIIGVFALIFVVGFFIIFGLWILSMIFPPVGTFIETATDPLWIFITDIIVESRK